MPGTQEQNLVEPLSYTPTGENGETTPKILPQAASRNIMPQDDKDVTPPSPGEAGSTISNVLGAAPTKPPRMEVKEIVENGETTPKILPQVAPRSTALQTNDENGMSQSSSPFDGKFDNEELFGDGPKNHAYATIDFSKKTPKKSIDSGVEDQSLKRSDSEETPYSSAWNLDKTLEKFNRKLSDKLETGSGTPPTGSPPSYRSTDGSQQPLIPDKKSDNSTIGEKPNRTWPRVKYSMQQKGFIIFSASAIILGISTVSVYLQDKEKFIAFVTNSPNYITIPVIALASLLAISPIFYAIKQFRNTEEHQIQGENADEILDEVLEHQQDDKVIKSVRLEYSNNTHSNFIFNAWESKNDFINIDEKVISRTNKIKSVINNRPLFTVLLTGVVAANIALPLGLLTTHGVNGVQKFYQNPLTNNIGLLLLIGSGVLALLVVCLGVHYYNKTNCTNLIYSQEKIDSKKVNERLIGEVKQERTKVLEENHSKDAKRSSLTLEQVVVQSHNCKDAVCSIG